jgi:hypothetical protein
MMRRRKRVPELRQQLQKFFKRTNWPMENQLTSTSKFKAAVKTFQEAIGLWVIGGGGLVVNVE